MELRIPIQIMPLTFSHAERLQGWTSLELITIETPDISEYLDFGWYDRVWFKEDAGLRETQIGRFLGPSHKVGSLMRYLILLPRGIQFLRTTVQHVTYLEKFTDASNQRLELYDRAIKEIFHEKYTEEAFAGPNSTNPTVEMWAKLSEDEEYLQSEFKKVFYNPAAT